MDKIEEFVRSKLPENFIKNHVKEVVKEALWLCEFYPDADKEVVRAGAWLHDVIHPMGGYEGDDHNVASAKIADEFLNSINYDSSKTKKIVRCVERHRTSRPPRPEEIEEKIVASADNLTHFTAFDYLLGLRDLEWGVRKLKRDLDSEFMLPEALEKAKKLAEKLEKKHNIKIL